MIGFINSLHSMIISLKKLAWTQICRNFWEILICFNSVFYSEYRFGLKKNYQCGGAIKLGANLLDIYIRLGQFFRMQKYSVW